MRSFTPLSKSMSVKTCSSVNDAQVKSNTPITHTLAVAWDYHTNPFLDTLSTRYTHQAFVMLIACE